MTYLVAGRTAFHRRSQHTELPPQSASGLAVDDSGVFVQLAGERIVYPVVAGKIPRLARGKLVDKNAD